MLLDKPPSKYKFKLVLQGGRLSPEAAAAGVIDRMMNIASTIFNKSHIKLYNFNHSLK